jgi:hypothetical protein
MVAKVGRFKDLGRAVGRTPYKSDLKAPQLSQRGYRHSQWLLAGSAPGQEADVDRKQETERVRDVIDSIAEGALALPPEARLTFIKAEIVKVRGDFLRTYEADPELAGSAMELVDGIYSQVKAKLKFLEQNGHSGAMRRASTAL